MSNTEFTIVAGLALMAIGMLMFAIARKPAQQTRAGIAFIAGGLLVFSSIVVTVVRLDVFYRGWM